MSDDLLQRIAELMDEIKVAAGKGGAATTVWVSHDEEHRTITGHAVGTLMQLVEEDERLITGPVVVRAPKVRHFLLLEFIPDDEGAAYTMEVKRDG